MNATSETLLKQIFYQIFLSQQVKRNVIITNKNGKYEFTYELPNEARLKRLKFIVNTTKKLRKTKY